MGSYNQPSGQSMDFNMSDSYVQPSGQEINFRMIDATKLALTETLAVNEAFARESNYFRNYVASLAFNDSDIQQMGKTLEETAFLNDQLSKTAEKPVGETFTVDETYNRTGAFFRTYNEDFTVDAFTQVFATLRFDESVSFNDADIRNVSKPLQEALSFTDGYSKQGDFFRSQSEQLSLNDFVKPIVIQFANLAETLVFDEVSTKKTGKSIDEALAAEDVYSDESQFFRVLNAGLGLNGDYRFKLSKQLSDGFAISTFAPLTTVINLREDFVLDEVSRKKPVKALDESLGLNEVIPEKTVLAVRSERIGVNDADVRRFERTLEEGFGANDVYSRIGEFRRGLAEDLVVDDADTKLVVSIFETETLGLQTETVRDIRKVLTEQPVFDDVYSRTADYFKDFQEQFDVADSKDFQQDLFRTFEENLTLQDSVFGARTIFRNLNESLAVLDVYNYLFREGPGIAPYYVRNKFVEKNSLNNEYVTKTLQNVFESFNVSVDLGDREQT